MIPPQSATRALLPNEGPTPFVVVAGQGYVGLPIAMRAVEAGCHVVGYDIDVERVKRLRDGRSYVEDVCHDTLAAAFRTHRYEPTAEIDDCKGFDVAIITVPTPLRDGAPDLSFVEQAARTIGTCLHHGALVVLESTTYPGTTEDFVGPLLSEVSGLIPGEDFYLGYSPERIDPGNRVWRLENTPKVISGINESSLLMLERFYSRLVDKTVRVSTPKVAELVKLLENTFRHVNIALVNELAMFAAELGVDVWEAIAAASTKPFGYMPFTPGPGVGGHCLPVDPSYLSWKVRQTLGAQFRFVELANDVNDHMPDYVAQRVALALNNATKPIRGSRILVLGLAYKRNTGDARESPGPVLCDRLHTLGARVYAIDPYVDDTQFPTTAARLALTEPDLRSMDLIVVVTDHDDFDWDLVLRTGRPVLDTRHRLPRAPNVTYL